MKFVLIVALILNILGVITTPLPIVTYFVFIRVVVVNAGSSFLLTHALLNWGV